MTTILGRLRTHARANSGQFQVCLSVAEIREIVSEMERLGAEVARKDAALHDLMVGGNHIASGLVMNLGADFSTRFPFDAAPQAVYSWLQEEGKLGPGHALYDMWCCWAAMMKARPALAPLAEPELKLSKSVE